MRRAATCVTNSPPRKPSSRAPICGWCTLLGHPKFHEIRRSESRLGLRKVGSTADSASLAACATGRDRAYLNTYGRDQRAPPGGPPHFHVAQALPVTMGANLM